MAETTERVEPTIVETKQVDKAASTETSTTEVKTEGTESAQTPSVAPEWMTKRLNQTTARNKELKSQVEAREARIAELEAQLKAKEPPKTGGDGAGGLDEAEVERRANERARTMSAEARAQEAWNSMCANITKAGEGAHADFEAKIGPVVKSLVDFNDAASFNAYASFVNVANETGKAHEIIYDLAQNPDEFAKILSMPSARMAVEVARMVTPEGQILSKAPRPIRPVGNRGNAHEAIKASDPDRADNLDTATWMARREKEISDRGGARR